MDNVWELITENIFLKKSNLILEVQKYSKISAYEKKTKTLKIRVFKAYVEKLITTNINHIKEQYETITKKNIEKIYVNNHIFRFNKVFDAPENTREINEFKISFDAIKDDDSFKTNTNDDINLKNRIVKLTFYNEVLFYTKNVEVDLAKYNYKKNLKFGLIGLILIFPGIYFLTKYYLEKKYVKNIYDEVTSLLSLKYKPLNKKTNKVINDFILKMV